MKTVENLLVELQDELHYQKYPSEVKGKIFKEEHLQGDYFPLHMIKTVVERYVSQATPAPLSEQKQEEETVKLNSTLSFKGFITINDESEVKVVHVRPNKEPKYGIKADGSLTVVYLHSDILNHFQHTAKQIEETSYQLKLAQTNAKTRGELLNISETIVNNLNEALAEKDKQIDQYKARIVELEALLKNSRNAIAELNETELQFGIQLCNDIDTALEAEILTIKNK